MWSQVALQLDVKLNETEHGNGNGESFESLYPDMRECWTVRLCTIPTCGLCDDRHDGEKDADKAVLEDAKVNDL